MKRMSWLVFTLLLVFAVLSCGVANAEGIDIDSLSVKELLDLQTKIDHKIVELSPYEDCILYEGKYIVGKEIEAGTYVLDCVYARENVFHQCFVRLNYFDDSKGEYVVYETDWGANLYTDEKYSVTLKENDMIDVDDGILVAHKR